MVDAPDPVSATQPSAAEPVTFTRRGLMAGARAALPLVVSTTAFGAVFGVLALQKGLSVLEAALMSILVFAGSAQLIAANLWEWPVPVLTIIFTTLIVNLRYLLQGAALRPLFARVSALKAYGSVFLLADENWALSVREFARGNRDAAFLLGGGIALLLGWLAGTLAGVLGGSLVGDPAQWGLDFAFTAVFAALLVGMWRGKSDLLPWATAAGVAVLAYQLLPGTVWYILLGGLAGSIVGAIRDGN